MDALGGIPLRRLAPVATVPSSRTMPTPPCRVSIDQVNLGVRTFFLARIPQDLRVKRKVHEPFPSRGGRKGTPQAPGRASWTVHGPLSMRSFCGPRGHGGGGEPRDGPETDPIGFGFDWKANPPFPGVVNSAMGSQRVRALARCGRQPRRASPWRGRSAIDGGLRGGEEGWTRTG